MTQEENAQVMAYIAKLQAENEAKASKLRLQVTIARAEVQKMAAGMQEIYNMANSPNPVEFANLKRDVLAIIDYFCPDFMIPF